MNHETNPRPSRIRMLTPLRRRSDAQRRRFRRGAYLLPSMFTMGNMFCGYACIVYAMRGEFVTAAPFIGLAIVVDMLDGRIARLTGTTSDFGIEFVERFRQLVEHGRDACHLRTELVEHRLHFGLRGLEPGFASRGERLVVRALLDRFEFRHRRPGAARLDRVAGNVRQIPAGNGLGSVFCSSVVHGSSGMKCEMRGCEV